MDDQRRLFDLVLMELEMKAKELDAQNVHSQYVEKIEDCEAKAERAKTRALNNLIPQTSRKQAKRIALPQTSPRDKRGRQPIFIPTLDMPLARDLSNISMSHSSSRDMLVDDEPAKAEHPGNFQPCCVIGPALTGSVQVTPRKNFWILRMIMRMNNF